MSSFHEHSMKPLSDTSPYAVLLPAEMNVVRVLILAFAIFSLLPSNFTWTYTVDASIETEGLLATKLEWGSIFLLSGIIVFRHLDVVVPQLRRLNPFLILILLWCLASTLWSPYPGVTFKRAIQLYGIVAFGLAIQLTLNPLELFLDYLLFALMGILVASLIVVVVNPTIGIDYELGGAWRGVLLQKNEAGQVASLAALLWQVRASTKTVSLRAIVIGLGFSLFMLVMAKSSTSIMITAIGSFLFHLFRKRHIDSSYYLTRIALTLLVVALVSLHIFYTWHSRLPTWEEISSPLAALFGKKSDLTGRTDIWNLVFVEIQHHWIAGLGYGAFWLGAGSLSQPIIDAVFWVPLQSHNGYLDILNEQGLIGLGLAILCLFAHTWSIFQLGRHDRGLAAFLGAYLVIVVITNFTESSLFRGMIFQNVFFTLTMVGVTCTVGSYRDAESPESAAATPSKFIPPSKRVSLR